MTFLSNKQIIIPRSVSITIILMLGIILLWGIFGGDDQPPPTSENMSSNLSQTQQKTQIKELTLEQKGDAKHIKIFSDQILKIETEAFEMWYEIQEQTKIGSSSAVKNALKRGSLSMDGYKKKLDLVVVPSLSDKSTEQRLRSAKDYQSKAYYSGQLYFAFTLRMIASNDMKEIDSSWAGAEEMKQEMFENKAKASAGMLMVLKQYGI